MNRKDRRNNDPEGQEYKKKIGKEGKCAKMWIDKKMRCQVRKRKERGELRRLCQK